MARLFTLGVDMVTRTSKFENGMNKAQARTKKFRKSFAVDMGMMAKAFGALVLAVGARKLITAFNASREALDVLAKSARKLGIEAQSLQRLQFAAGLAGLEDGKLTVGIAKFTKAIGEAKSGLSTMVRAFDALGIEVESFQNLSVEDQFLELSKRFQALPNRVDRIRFAMDLFGRSGTDMLNIFMQTEDQLRATFAEADKIKGVFTDKDLQGIEAANDAVSKLKQSFATMANIATIQLAPALQLIADKMTAITSNREGLLKTSGMIVNLASGGVLGMLTKALKLNTLEADKNAAAWEKRYPGHNFNRRDKENAAILQAETDALATLQRRMEEAQPFADKIAESVKTPREKFREFRDNLREALELGLIDMQQFRKAMSAERDKLSEALGGDEENALSEPFDKMNEAMEQSTQELEEFEKKSRGLGQQVSGVAAVASRILGRGGLSFGGINQTFAAPKEENEKKQTDYLFNIMNNTRKPMGVFA